MFLKPTVETVQFVNHTEVFRTVGGWSPVVDKVLQTSLNLDLVIGWEVVF